MLNFDWSKVKYYLGRKLKKCNQRTNCLMIIMIQRFILIISCIFVVISSADQSNPLADLMGQAPSGEMMASSTLVSSADSTLPSSSSPSASAPSIGTVGQLQGMYNTTFTPPSTPEWINQINVPHQFNSNEASIIDQALNQISLGIMIYTAMRPQMNENQLQAFYNQIFPLFKCISRFNVTDTMTVSRPSSQ